MKFFFFLIFLPIILSLVSTRRVLSISLGSLFLNSVPYEFFIEFANSIISLTGIDEPIILGGPNRYPPNYTILDNWVFENFILANEQFVKALQIFETGVSVNHNLCGN